jgi:hypothetical protein
MIYSFYQVTNTNCGKLKIKTHEPVLKQHNTGKEKSENISK